jgi:hemolysin activation/secretion protein
LISSAAVAIDQSKKYFTLHNSISLKLIIMASVTKTKTVKSGDWRTLESGWNVHFFMHFIQPLGAQVKVRYGIGWFGWDSQKQTLNGQTTVKLEVTEGSSKAYARVQIKVRQTSEVTYTYIAA